MKKKIIILMVVALFGVSIWWMKFRHKNPTAVGEEIVMVEAIPVKETTLPLYVQAIGALSARSVEITPEVAGLVRQIYFRDGSFVKQGTALIQLDDAIYKSKFKSANAKLAFTSSNYERMQLLGKKGVVAQQAIDQAEVDLKEKKAEADESKVMLNKMQLSAPFNGVVGKSKVSHGDYITVGQSIVTLTDTEHLRVEYSIPDKYLPLLKLGQKVSVKTAVYPHKTFAGTVAYIAPTINISDRSIAVYADVQNNDNQLKAGMFVNIEQSLGKDEKALLIPARSLAPVLEGEQVYKITDGKAYAVTVVIGKRIGEEVQVLSALSPGDLIITDGQLKVKNGTPVQIK